MARLPRLNLPDVPQHVIQHGNNREVCFFEEQDYKVYLSTLEEYSHDLGIAVHSSVLMTDRVHLPMPPKGGDGVSRLIQSLGQYYRIYRSDPIDPCGQYYRIYRSDPIDP